MVQRAQKIQSMNSAKPIGNITRGTTNPNRLRRIDRWLAGTQSRRLKASREPLVVDLGYGASPATAVELFERLIEINPELRVTGIEIEPERVLLAQEVATEQLSFILGGFEIPTPQRPLIVRAFNVLRQYEEADVAGIWATVCERLAPDGLFVDGTCDEIGRRASWIALQKAGPVSLTVAQRFGSFELPSEVAERLPKALIHRNLPGERIYDFLRALDQHWLQNSALAPFGNRQRWQASCRGLKDAGWPVLDGPERWRLGELTIAWRAVAPQ
ncbi:class I SAM-dependent methyltransferase [Psychromicrobium sp. YIM B11713]|uniref:class I SAM-dependent methyltransferase n=1 Tax=Psychromicrobium sp. YIM B11713 TaxID=3145233 RepID=UPI00374E7A33